MFGCSGVMAHSLMRRFEQTGISIDVRNRRDVRKQRQNKTVDLHSRIDVSGSSRHLLMLHRLNVSYQIIKTTIGINEYWCVIFFYFDPLLILTAASQTHDVAAGFQLHRSTEN